MDENGRIVTEGEQILIGGNDRYTPMCYQCYMEKRRKQEQ
jgi:thymidine kinase